MLTHMGFKVLVAKSGKEAVEIYDRQKGNIDLVILDEFVKSRFSFKYLKWGVVS